MKEECVVSPPAVLARVTRVRSTLLQSSLNSLRTHAYYDRYLAVVDPSYREVILGSLAPEWLPMEVAEAHYRACDALQLTTEEMHVIPSQIQTQIRSPAALVRGW